MNKELFVALDFNTENELDAFLKNFEEHPIPVKIGMSQFYMSGPKIVEELSKRGFPIFLDLKSHDIPNTVYLAMKQLSQYPIEMVTVHCMGGQEMMKAAVEGTNSGPYRPKLMGITQLTSTSQEMMTNDLRMNGELLDSVVHLAKLAQTSGMDGVVSSVLETRAIKQATAEDFLSLTPGIRLTKEKHDDQTRVATPQEAKAAGVDYLVVGRPITQAENPVEMYNHFLSAWRGMDAE